MVYRGIQDGDTALHYASAQGHADVITLLAKSGAKLDVQDKVSQGWTHTDVGIMIPLLLTTPEILPFPPFDHTRDPLFPPTGWGDAVQRGGKEHEDQEADHPADGC